MFRSHLAYLSCPACQENLDLSGTCLLVTEGTLSCSGCQRRFPVTGGVPRFVTSDNYAAAFGLQWLRHARTQLDSETGLPLSRTRFFEETGWRQHMDEETILEAGSGAGRFTEVVADTGAMIVSFDYSRSVDVNYASNGYRENVLIVQADVYQMPFRASFDRVCAFGLIQHTPDPVGAVRSLAAMVRPGGSVCIDCYERTPLTRLLDTIYWPRAVTWRMPPERLYSLTCRWIDLLWPLASLLRRCGRIGRSINWRLGVPDYSDTPLSDEQLREWARLDLFDILSPRYMSPQPVRRLQQWAADLDSLETLRMRSLVVLRGRTQPHPENPVPFQ